MYLVGVEQFLKAAVDNMLFLPETEKDTQGRHDVDLVRRMRGNKGQNVTLRDSRHMLDAARIQVREELAQIQAIVIDGELAAAQILQMGYQLLHLCPNLTVKGMRHGGKAALADVAELQHVVKHLDASDLLTFLWTYRAMKVAG